ncbi:hypothetical protein BU15DRAFT_59396 [Melanogaster broomeanus]|nr:hypothetical protein BU15DRAFT_59396 [Melanogaster broomeanus]
MVVIQISHTCVEVLLAMRAYALFNKNRRIAILFFFLITAEFANMGVSVSKMAADVSFETVCILVPVPRDTLSSGMIVPLTQTALVGTITFKSAVGVYAGWGNTPLVSLLIREGLATYLLAIVLFGFAAFWSLSDDVGATSLILWAVFSVIRTLVHIHNVDLRVLEFISFITSEAAEECHMEKRKTIGVEDILCAVALLGFEDYAETLKVRLAKTGARVSRASTAQGPHVFVPLAAPGRKLVASTLGADSWIGCMMFQTCAAVPTRI